MKFLFEIINNQPYIHRSLNLLLVSIKYLSYFQLAPLVQQQEFWKRVAEVSRKQMKKFKKVWVSTHGLGVPYLHVRISDSPKYYFSEALSKE